MKQKSYIFFLIFLFPLLSGCSLILSSIIPDKSTTPTSTVANIQNPAEILKNAKNEMNQLSGYSWEVTTDQEFQLRNEQKRSTTNAVVHTEMTNPNTFHMTIQGTSQSGNEPEQSEMLELYLINSELYQKSKNRWNKKKLTNEQVQKSFRLDRTIQNPNYTFDILTEQLNQQLNMEEETDQYVLSINIDNPTLARKYGESSVESLLAKPDVVASQVEFQSYQLELQIDKHTQQILEVQQKISLSVPLLNNDILDVQANVLATFQGEVQSISLPPELRSGDEDLEDDPFTTDPYDPGDKI